MKRRIQKSNKEEVAGDGSRTGEEICNKIKSVQENKVKSIQENTARKPGSRCFSLLKYFIFVLFLPPFLNMAALHQEKDPLRPSIGADYDVGYGQKMFFACHGTGTPAVLLDAPTGMSSDVWEAVVKQLSTHARVCVYDRAGLGFSDRPYQNFSANHNENNERPTNRWQEYTVERMADDLHGLVTYRSQQLTKPFIYVGAEMGALVARFYTNIYETDVSDIILIEPLVEGLFEMNDAGAGNPTDYSPWVQHWFAKLLPGYQALQMSAAFGTTRLGLMTGAMDTPVSQTEAALSQETLMRQKYLLCNPRHLASVVDEHHYINDSFKQIRTLSMMKQFPSNVSVTVINGNYHDEQLPSQLNQIWSQSQEYLLRRIHPTANHIVVNGADRKMLYRKPEVIVEHIRKVLKQRQRKRTSTQASNSQT